MRGRGVQVQVHQRAGDEDVDDGEGVRDDVQDEVIRVSRRGRKHDNNRDEPVLGEANQGGVERGIASPEVGEGKDTLASDLLDQTALGEDDRKHVPERRQRDEDGQGALGFGAEHVPEEGGGENAARGEDLFAGDGGEVGDVGQHVEDCYGAEGEGCGNLEGAYGVLGLSQRVVGVAVADVGPDDVVEGGHDAVGRAGCAGEGVGEVVGLLNAGLEVAAEGGETGEDDEQEDEQLDYAEEVLQTQTPV